MKTRLKLVRLGRPSAFRVMTARDVSTVLRLEARGLDRECFWRIDLDSRRKLIGYELVSVGSLDAAIVTGREIYKGALLNNAHGIVVAHSHPSGDPNPSRADRRVTATLVLAGAVLGVEFIDHVILAEDRYYSFNENRLL